MILVGEQNSQRGIRRGLVQSGFSRTQMYTVADMDDASELLSEISEAGDTVLFESHIREFED